MACTTRSLISLNSCAFPSKRIPTWPQKMRNCSKNFIVHASTSTDDDCNTEECAPDKEVGNLSMQWVAEEQTKVVGTFPPKKRGWTGYVEKDTAGQTNIYSVEPAIYVADSAISSGAAGSSSQGSDNTAGLTAILALISIAAASSILLQVNKNQTVVKTVPYTGPPLSYYINKFKPVQFVEASIPVETQNAPSVEASLPPSSEIQSTETTTSASASEIQS
ncbi:proline-rich family protein [Carex rostrata]